MSQCNLFLEKTENENYLYSPPHNISIFTVGTYAIYKVIELAFLKIRILSSLLVLAIISIANPYPVNNELFHLFQKILSTSSKTISFLWVLSYIEIPGNEKVDSKGNEATTSQSSTKINKIT